MFNYNVKIGIVAMRRNTTDRPRGTFLTWYSAEQRGKKFVNYIEENFMKDLSVPMIAAEFNISASHLAHFFKQYSGKSLIEYVNELRIQKAKLFLEKEDTTISAIAKVTNITSKTNIYLVYRIKSFGNSRNGIRSGIYKRNHIIFSIIHARSSRVFTPTNKR